MVNFKIIDSDIIENKYYINHLQNENSYVVLNNNEYIEYLLLNINIYDYIKDEFMENYLNDLDNLTDFDNAYLCNFEVDYVNGFLCVEYNEDDVYNFLNRYEKYFIDDLRIDLIELYDDLIDEIERLDDLGLLY